MEAIPIHVDDYPLCGNDEEFISNYIQQSSSEHHIICQDHLVEEDKTGIMLKAKGTSNQSFQLQPSFYLWINWLPCVYYLAT